MSTVNFNLTQHTTVKISLKSVDILQMWCRLSQEVSSHLDDEVGKKQKLTAVVRTKLIGSGPGSDPALADLKVKKVNKLKTKQKFFLKTLYFFSPISVFHHLIFRPFV